MRALAMAVASLFVILSGCSAPEPTPAPAADPEPEGPAWQRFEASYSLVRTEVETPAISSGADSSNCVMLDDDALVNGTATVTWDPEPTDPEMELVLKGPDDVAFKAGKGEIVLELRGFRVEQAENLGGSPLAWQIPYSSVAGAVVERTATLAVAFDVLLDDPEDEFTPDEGWGCSIGH